MQKPLNIIITNSARKYIGEAAHCMALAHQLRKRGHQVTLVVRQGFELEKRVMAEGIPHLSLAMPGSFSPLQDWRDVKAFQNLLRESQADLVHCHRGKDHWMAVVAMRTGGRRVPIVRTRHVVVPMHSHAFNKWLLRRATDQLIAVSGKAADSLGALRRSIDEKVTVIYSATDLEVYSPKHRSEEWRTGHGLEPQHKLVGLIARIQRIKGQEVFLRAAAKLATLYPDARFLIAGAGDPRKLERFREFARNHKIVDRIILAGWLDDISAALASLDVGVVASLGSEGSSRVTFEYMASGVPVVATRVGGIPEILEHERTGLIVEPGDSDALAAAVGRVLNDSSLTDRLRSNALEHVTANHNYDRWISDVLQVYERALTGRVS